MKERRMREEHTTIWYCTTTNGSVKETSLLLLPKCTAPAKHTQTFSYGKGEQGQFPLPGREKT